MLLQLSTVVILALAVAASGCNTSEARGASSSSEDDEAPAEKSPKRAASATAASATAAPAATTPPDPPALAAVKAGSWKDPLGRATPDLKLAETALDKCYGFKGYAMKLPEGATLQTLVGARACAVYLPSEKKQDLGVIVMTDEVKVEFYDKAKLENITARPLDEQDAFLYEVEAKGNKQLVGWVDRKVGPHKTRCNSFQNSRKDGAFPLEVERAFIELCRTLTYSEPPKK